MPDFITRNILNDGVDRRGFLSCMAWAGTGVLYTLTGGVARSQVMAHHAPHSGSPDLSFVQISDSHMGFNKPANADVAATLRAAVDRISALEPRPAFLIHTGDISHLSKPEEFDTVDSILKSARVDQSFFVPGEHDVLAENGTLYRDRYGKNTRGDGWYSFDIKGVHFIGLVNVMNLKAGGLGSLGAEQLEWLKKDLDSKTSSTPLVVFAHVPLWTVYQDWGWGTEDGMTALSYMKRFGSVTVLNGHIHQNVQKVEGNMTFHTACSTAFPQPKPGTAPAPGPMQVPADQLRSLLGLTQVAYVRGEHALAVMDSSLDSSAASEISIHNFAFGPQTLSVQAGSSVTWTNRDDIPHNVVSTAKAFQSPALDTDDKFSHTFAEPGKYSYFCSLHPKMTGQVVVSG